MRQMHSLLRRQLKQQFGGPDFIPAEWQGFVEAVNDAYWQSDADRNMLERSLDLSSQELLQANSELRTIFQAFPDLFYRLDHDGTILDCKAGSGADLYIPLEKLIGKRIQDIPFDIVGRKFFDAIHQVRENKAMVSIEYLMEIKGEVNYYEARLLPLFEDQIIAIVRNITDKKQAEDALKESEVKLRQVIDLVPHFIFAKDRNGRFILVNQAVAEAYGTTVENLIGKTDADFNPNKDEVAYFLQNDLQVISSGQPKEILEEKITDSKGNTRILNTTKIPFRLSMTENDAVLGVSTDITASKQAEEERRILESRLQRAQKMEAVGTLAGGVAHDLNNVLSGVVGYPDLLLMQIPEDSPLRKPIITIQESGKKASNIVQDLLTLARRGVAAKEILNLNDIISEYLKSPEYEKLTSYHPEAELETNLETGLFNISGSRVHLSKTIMNLISNAAEAMPDGGHIFISTENRYIDTLTRGYDSVDEGEYITLKIVDTGIGISSKDLDRIFEPFYTKKVMGRSGTGLGMAVVWGTVKDHKGYIDVQSIEGRGTTFTLYFPATRREASQEKVLLSIEEYMGNGESILVVDDVKEQREVASTMLSTLGYSTHAVSGAKEAVEYLKEHTVDLIVLDMIMDPGPDGLDTYKEIIKMHPGQKAIIASGFSETDRVKEAQRLGVGKYVKKPYTLEKIGLVVKEELEK